MHLFSPPALAVRRNPFAFNHLPGVWCAMLSGNQSKDVKGLVHQSRPNLQLIPTSVLWQCSVNQKLSPSSPGHGPHLIPFDLRASMAHTLGMSVKWGSSRNLTELPVFSRILLPLWEIIWQPGTGSMQSMWQIWLPKEGTLLDLCTTHLGLCHRVWIMGYSAQSQLGDRAVPIRASELTTAKEPFSHTPVWYTLCHQPHTRTTQTNRHPVSQTIPCNCHSKYMANTISTQAKFPCQWKHCLCQTAGLTLLFGRLCRWKRQDLQVE